MDARELAEWRAFEKLEPFGDGRADLRMGISTAAILNSRRGRGVRALKPLDLLPDFEKRFHEKTQSVEEMKREVLKAVPRA